MVSVWVVHFDFEQLKFGERRKKSGGVKIEKRENFNLDRPTHFLNYPDGLPEYLVSMTT